MKKRILHILNSRAYSGAENVVLSIIGNLKEYEFAYVSRKGDIEKELEKRGVRHYLVDKLTIKEIKRCVADFKPDLIHAHDFTASVLVGIGIRRVPAVSHLHNNPLWIRKYCIKSILYYLLSRKFIWILSVSKSVIQEYVFGKKIESKSKVIYNPVNIEEIRKMAQAECDKKYDIIALGRLSEQKNPKLFVDIIEECSKRDRGIKAAMLGNGELYENVKEYISYKNMEEHIDLLGFQENPYAYLKHAKVLCIPSQWEGFGMVAVEALILGKPVVASNVGGLPDIVNDTCGKICIKKNEFADEIMRLLTEENYYQEKSEKAVKRAEELNIKIDYYNGLRKIYQSILGK